LLHLTSPRTGVRAEGSKQVTAKQTTQHVKINIENFNVNGLSLSVHDKFNLILAEPNFNAKMSSNEELNIA
jgi:hypothetical protein